MGGKEKKGQRTKGNVKPSSSGRSAELLGNVTGFVGFTGLAEGAYVPVLNVGSSANEETDFNIPGDFRLTLRKMGKKDSTTKIKALNEFVDLCSQSPVEALKSVLPFWPRIYAKLAIDNDRRVRENAQKAHCHIASKLGRNLAPQLKELMGIWFTSQCDTYTPAAAAASQALKACFPESKLPEAIAFCHTEIMGYINDCFFKNDDIQEEQKERVLVGALSGYSLLLQQIQKEVIEQESRFEKHRQLWSEPKLYKVVEKDSSSVVKQAWFRTLLTLSQTFPQLVQENASKILPCLFGFLDDPDTLTQSSMWETTLKLLLIVENAASHVNLSSGMMPRFLNLLRNGCFGNASTVGPLVLPLTQLLRDNIKPQQKDSLNVQLIASLRQGFSDRMITTSAIEAAAFSSTFAQSLDFSSQNIVEAAGLRKLFESQVIPLLDSLVQGKRSDILLCHLMRQLTLMLYRWFGKLETAANELWATLDAFIRTTLTRTPHPEAPIVQQLCLVLSILMDPTFKADRERRQPMTRSGRIRFNEMDTEVCEQLAIPTVLSDKLNTLYVSLCQKALECSEQNRCQICLDLLACLLRHDSVTQQFLTSQSLGPQQMISSFIQPILEQLHDGTSASLLFTLLNAVESGRRLQLLEEIIHDQSTCLALATTALEKFSNKETVLEWLHGHQIQSLLATTTQQLSTFSHEDPTAAWNLIRAAFNARNTSRGQELVLPESHIDAVLSALTSCLTAENVSQNPFQQVTNPLCSLWQSAARSIYSFESTGRFLDAIFDALCSNIALPDESVDDLTSIWNTGAAFNAHARATAAATIMKRHLLANPDTRIIDRFVQLFGQISQLVDNDAETLRSLISLILPNSSEWKALTNDSNAVHLVAKELLTGSIYFADFTGNFRPIQLESWCNLIKVALVASDVAIRVKSIESQRHLIHLLFYAATSAQLLLNLYSKRPQDLELQRIQPLADRLNANLDALLTECSPAEQLEIYQTVKSMSSQGKGWIWILVARKLLSICDIMFPECDPLTPVLTDSDGKRNLAVRNLTDQLACLTEQNWKESRHLLNSIRILLNSLKTEADSETLDAVVATVQVLQHWQQQYSEEFLFGADLKSLPQPTTSTPLTVVEMIHLLSTVVELYPNQLPNQLWDFVLCSMTSWCSTLEDSWNDWGPNHIHNVVLLSFTVALSRLVLNCSNLVLEVQQQKRDVSGLPPNLTGEWDDVFSEAAFSAIVPIFLRLSQRWNKINSPVLDYVMECLVASLIHVPKQHLNQTIEVLSPLVLSKQPAIQLGAYCLIVKLLPDLAASEAGLVASEATDEQEKTERVPPHVLLELLQKTTLEGLDDVRVGDLHLIEPYSEECSRFIAHCLTWKLVLNLCGCSSSELRYQYAAYLGNSGLIAQLMDDLFRIIPHAAQQHSVDLEQELQPQITITTQVVQDLATQVYTSALRHLPAVIRRWWNNADKRTASLVEKFTAKCVSPVLCSSDLQHVTSTWDNMTVRVRLSAREAIATYKLNEEASMELVVQLPANYPLGNITVEGGRKVGVTTGQWRTWMLQLTTFLMHQNGSILEGLTLWKRNVDKRFEGIEECYICYYVLHGSNYQLPKLTCRTCRKKFHAACLYKWFSTSNNSTCPLCRNLF